MHRVAITGVGAVSCLGNDAASIALALREGRSGIAIDEERQELGFRSPLSGMILDYTPPKSLTRKNRKTMTDFGVWSFDACLQALDMAGLDPEALRTPRSGAIFGCDSSCLAAVEQTETLREQGDTARLGSGLIFRAMNSTITMNLNILFGFQGASWTLSSACSSGGHSIGQGAELIAGGRQDRMLCGGAQEITWQSICSFDGLGAFSTRLDAPTKASRPFDAGRDGLVPGGGAAAVLLERMDLAQERGAAILGEVLGYGFSSDGGHISQPNGEGLGRAMRMALEAAGITPADVDTVNAHATSTVAGDAAEALAIKDVFAGLAPRVMALKALTGHELWMSGASQVAYAAIMAREGFTAGHPTFSEPDQDCEGLNISAKTLDHAPRVMLCNAAGFGGTNSCLALRLGA